MRRALPDEPFRFRMGVSRGSVRTFFGVAAHDDAALRERGAILAADPSRALAIDGAAPFVDEAIATLRSHGALPRGAIDVGDARKGDPRDDGTLEDETRSRLRVLGVTLAPDLLVLDHAARLVAGVVCFPSSWSLETKIGRPLAEIHAPVPGLEASVGTSIARFLDGMRPGDAFLRSGFGLSSSGAFDHHPSRRIPRLGPESPDGETFVRIEDQALVKLPATCGVLFGIRIRNVPWSALDRDHEALRGLARALESMPLDVAAYKGIADALPSLRRRLEERLRALGDASRIA